MTVRRLATHPFLQKSTAVRESVADTSHLPDRALAQRRYMGSILDLQRTVGNRAVQRLPVQEGEHHESWRLSGELARGRLLKGNKWIPATGDGGSPTATPKAPGKAPTPAKATPPRLKKTTVSPLATEANGGFNWGVRWSIDHATTSTNGWIVQHVDVRQDVESWHPPLLPGHTLPITAGQTPWGGLSKSWYPIWEAWQVRGGAVFVGDSTATHNADTFAQNPVGASTKGKTEVVGRADFYPDLTLPTDFSVSNSAPAWSLPVTNADPALKGGTSALDHKLTATWDGVNDTGTTTATTV
jgi:hypothetical protein